MGRGPEGRGQREGSWAERGELEKVGIVQGGGRTKTDTPEEQHRRREMPCWEKRIGREAGHAQTDKHRDPRVDRAGGGEGGK